MTAGIERLSVDVSPDTAAALDGLLEAARSALVPAGAQLESVKARLDDPDRWLWAAFVEGRAVGFVDASREDEEVRIGQLVVAPSARFRGAGRALVEAVARTAEAEGAAVLKAWILDERSGGFWSSLDFERGADGAFRRPLPG